MRKIVLVAAIAGAAMTLSACSGGAEDDGAMTEADSQVEAAGAADDATAEAAAVLDANTATAEQLAGASGVTPELAEAIVSGRPYATVVDLNARLGQAASPEAATTVLQSVFVPVNLNTASREEIALIPGMTDRMIGEFLEYRPYEDMAEFDREIGKYVDAAEVARFRLYVAL